jgi:hypothetical protein
MKKYLLVVIVALTIALPVYLSAEAEVSPQREQEKSWGIIPLPILAYGPETGFMFGALGLLYSNPDPENPESLSNMLQGSAAYTTKNQIVLSLLTDWFFKSGANRLYGYIVFQKFPYLFWGIGPDTDEDMEEAYTPVEFEFLGSYMWKLFPHFYLGPLYYFSYMDVKEKEEGGLLDQGDIQGSEGAVFSGVGLQLTRDIRDNSFYPRRGSFLRLRALYAPKILGSDENLGKFEFEYSRYFQIHKLHVIAVQYYMESNWGEVPFHVMPKLGGDTNMRGYYEGRFIDKNYITVQGEYRFPIVWRLGGAVFGSAGQVAPQLNEFSFNNLKVAGGLGLRFAIDKEEPINIRIDLGISEMGTGFYVQFREAF